MIDDEVLGVEFIESVEAATTLSFEYQLSMPFDFEVVNGFE